MHKPRKSLNEFNIKSLKFYKLKYHPQSDLDRSKVALGFTSFLYSKLLGQLADQKGQIYTFFVKALNANYTEFMKIKKSSGSANSFQLKDFKYPYLGLIFYRQNPETVVDAESMTMDYFNNIFIKFVQPQKPTKPFSFYNYFLYFSPEDIKKVKLSEIKKVIKPTAKPTYNAGKVDLTTVFISNYLSNNLAKEFAAAQKEIISNPGFFNKEPEVKKPVTPKKTEPGKKEEPASTVPKTDPNRLKPLSSIKSELPKDKV